MARFEMIIGCLLVMAVTTIIESDAQIWVNIAGIDYYFEDQAILLNWFDADYLCNNLGMRLIGFETQQEWDDVMNFQDINGIHGRFWTSGVYIPGSTIEWEWGVGTGNMVFGNDPRWITGQPWNSIATWNYERIKYTFIGFSNGLPDWESLSQRAQVNVVCEQ